MLVQVETESEVQDNLKLVLENAKGNQNTARLKFSFEKNIYIYVYFFNFFFTSLMLNASRSPVVLFHQNLHCNSASVNLTCSLLDRKKIDKNWTMCTNKNLVRELLKNLYNPIARSQMAWPAKTTYSCRDQVRVGEGLIAKI